MISTHLLQWRSAVDLLVLTTAIYLVLHWSREARALRITFGILTLEAGAIASGRMGLPITASVLHAGGLVAALILIILFQPELRHAINRLEVALLPRQRGVLHEALEAIAIATFSLAAARRGALIVIERREPLNELVRGGVPLGGQVSTEILEAIFRKVSPVHDGAALIEGNRIVCVGAVLPLAHREDLPRRWGTRHRAAMGLAERCDALVVVASEERGDVTLMHDSSFETVANVDALMTLLRRLMPAPAQSTSWLTFFRREFRLQLVAATLAFAIWTSFVYVGIAVRLRTVPIEFSDLAPGLQVADQSAAVAELRLHGSSWLLDSIDAERLVIRLSLAGRGEGPHSVEIPAGTVRLPVGISADNVSPQRVQLRLTRQSGIDVQAPGTAPTR
jgi:diadenylate cyclase